MSRPRSVHNVKADPSRGCDLLQLAACLCRSSSRHQEVKCVACSVNSRSSRSRSPPLSSLRQPQTPSHTPLRRSRFASDRRRNPRPWRSWLKAHGYDFIIAPKAGAASRFRRPLAMRLRSISASRCRRPVLHKAEATSIRRVIGFHHRPGPLTVSRPSARRRNVGMGLSASVKAGEGHVRIMEVWRSGYDSAVGYPR